MYSFEGLKYKDHSSSYASNSKDIVTAIRADLKVAAKKEFLPKNFKASVSIQRYSNGCTIRVKIKKNSIDFIKDLAQDDIWESEEIRIEINKLKARVKSIMDEYRYENSDLQSDYFHTNFYTSILFDEVGI